MSMPIRTHIGRDFDHRSLSNLSLFVLMLLAAGVALVLWLNGEPASLFLAPVQVFLVWALMREIDPDNDWTAIVAALLAGGWVLAGMPAFSALAVAALMLGARLVTESTGRRPLPVDLGVAAVAGIAISFTVEGWVAGFGLAIAIYLDDRLALDSRGLQVGTAALTAVGSTVVASVMDVFPRTFPEVVPYVVIPVGLIALLLVVRDPAPPISQVDAHHSAFMRKDRLQASRTLVGILVFASALLIGQSAEEVVPLAGALVLAIVSNEVARIRRPDL